jgi:hypothetical protein
MRLPVATLSLVFAAFSIAARSSGIPEDYSLLRRIKSPQELVFPLLPKKYCVPVTMSGGIADEMQGSLDSLKLDPPQYHERFDGKTFTLALSNSNYPARTRELLGGIMNPAELIDVVVSSVVKYREGESFAAIARDTYIKKDTAAAFGRPVVVLRLLPKGERFAYVYQDMGAFVHESWLTMLAITIDTATRAVYELSTVRYSRTFDANVVERPAPSVMNARYLFDYKDMDGVMLPSQCVIYFNGVEALKLEAIYRREGKYFVFDRKEICSSLDGKPICLTVSYGEYRLGSCAAVALSPKSLGKKYAKRLELAAALSREANEKLRIGKIMESVRVLQKLVEQYGDTPQAVEARRLLGQLPKELQ